MDRIRLGFFGFPPSIKIYICQSEFIKIWYSIKQMFESNLNLQPSGLILSRCFKGTLSSLPDKESWVNSSFGSSITKSGPKTTLDFFEL